MKRLLFLALIIAGCGDTVVEALDMGKLIALDLTSDMVYEYEPSYGGGGGSGLRPPPCARPEIDECLGPPSRSDRLKRPVEMDTK